MTNMNRIRREYRGDGIFLSSRDEQKLLTQDKKDQHQWVMHRTKGGGESEADILADLLSGGLQDQISTSDHNDLAKSFSRRPSTS